MNERKQRVTDEQIQAALACRLDDDCSRCPFVEAHTQKEKSCNDLQCTDFDAYKDLQDTRAQLAIAVKALEWALKYIGDGVLPDEGTPEHDCGYIKTPDEGYCEFCENYWSARDALKEIQE